MEKLALSVTELQEALGISYVTARALLQLPNFPRARIGKRVVIPVEGLKEWLAAGGTEADIQEDGAQ